MKRNRYTVRKYDGDDAYSWAVFVNLPKGLGRTIWYGQAQPIVSGLTRTMGQYYKDKFEQQEKQS